MNAGPPLLEIDRLSIDAVSAGRQVRLVDEVSLNLQAGQVLGLVGESGCGKSLLSYSILRLLEPGLRIAGGNIRLEGKSLTDLSERKIRAIRGNEISMIFQEPLTALNPVFTVGDQVAEVFRTHRGMSKAEARRKAVDALAEVGVPSPEIRVTQYPADLSGGMRQRVMIAMALACRPKVLIADEPTTALDATIQAQILELMRGLQRNFGTAIIFISHDLGVVAEVADRVAVLYCGRVVEEAPVAELFQNPRHPYTRGLMRAVPQPDAEVMPAILHEIKGNVPRPGHLPGGCRFHPRCPIARDICTTSDPQRIKVGADHHVACWEATDAH
ncbi:MAG: ABC transporter ATP-binding protein [Devosia sp.]|nr:ABC transporter ATP-binding protein [Devosia sp.]